MISFEDYVKAYEKFLGLFDERITQEDIKELKILYERKLKENER